MAQSPRVLNLTRGFHMKLSQAEKGIANCAFAWVDYGKTVRDLSLAEAIAARNEDAKLREPLPSSEIPGLMYQPAPQNQAGYRESQRLAFEAGKFASERVQ